MNFVDLLLVVIASLSDRGIHEQMNEEVSAEHKPREGLQSAKNKISGSIKDI